MGDVYEVVDTVNVIRDDSENFRPEFSFQKEYKTSDYYFDDKDGEGHEANEVFFTLVGGKKPIPEGWKEVPFLLSSFRTNV